MAACVAAIVAAAGPVWPQQPAARPPIPQFPTGPDFAGVAGSAAETARIAALCGPNRNARDGYSTTPAFPGQTKAPIVTGTVIGNGGAGSGSMIGGHRASKFRSPWAVSLIWSPVASGRVAVPRSRPLALKWSIS